MVKTMASEKNTEQLILDAAKTVFLRKGFDGARMQEIADEAGINKALVHYYFRSKDKLFEAIFAEAFARLMPRIGEIIESDLGLFEKIWGIVDQYIDTLNSNPHLPIFIFHEISRNPERLVKLASNVGINPWKFIMSIQKEVDAGNIRPVHPQHLIVNMLALCIFPFVGRPMISGILMGGDQERYQQFLSERKVEVMTFIINSIKLDKTS